MTEAVATAARRRTKAQEVTVEYEPFSRVLRDALIQAEITTSMGSPNWPAFAELLDTVSYETLRKAVTGERQPTAKVMQEVAAALGADPSIFVEYRIWYAQSRFDPREVGVDQALKNLEAWTAFQKKQR